MRILHVTRDLAPRTNGGISVAVRGMARAQSRAGHGVAAISFDGYRPRRGGAATEPPREAREGQISVLRVTAASQLERARAFAADFAPDVLHVHHALLWPIAAELRDALGAPVALTAHVAQAELDRLRGLDAPTASARAESEAVARADLVHAPSRAAAAALPAGRSRPLVLPLGADDGERARAAAAAPRPRGGPVAFAGRFADVNGLPDLIAAIPELLERAPSARVAIAGGCPDSRRAESRWRRRLERELPAPARARVDVVGWLDRERLSDLYASCAVLVVPSWFETFGLVAVEGMLHGAPIAAASGGALAEILDHDDTALLSPPRDPGALARNAAGLVSNPDRARDLGAGAARAVRERYRWPPVIDALVAAYRERLA